MGEEERRSTGVLRAIGDSFAELGRAIVRKRGSVSPKIDAVDDRQPVHIRGSVALAEPTPLIAPFSGRSCVYYEFILFELCFTESRSGLGTWRERIVDSARQDFYIEDATGRAFVASRPLEVAGHMDTRSWPRSVWRLAEGVREHLRSLGADGEAVIADPITQVYICEGVLEVGGRVSAKGRGAWEPEPSATRSYRSAARRLRLLPHNGVGPLVTRG